jgi:hypothetical protein
LGRQTRLYRNVSAQRQATVLESGLLAAIEYSIADCCSGSGKQRKWAVRWSVPKFLFSTRNWCDAVAQLPMPSNAKFTFGKGSGDWNSEKSSEVVGRGTI